MHIYTTVSYYTMDSEHTIDSDIGVTGDKETVPVEKPEEDVSKSSDNIEAEGKRYPQDLQQGAEEKWLRFTCTN